MPPSIWPDDDLVISSTLSLLIDSDSATCIDLPPDDLHIPVVVKVNTENFNGIKRLAVAHKNLRDTMDPCNGMPFLVMTQTGAQIISDARCRPYCGRAVRCQLYKEASPGLDHNTATTVQVECHCQSADGCNGIFLQISLTSLVNQQAPGTLCEIDLSLDYASTWITWRFSGATLSNIEK